ncbi:MAG: AraC family transcriptional regulator [Tissierellaceae bacterium]
MFEDIKEIVNKFYISTNLPIISFTYEGDEIGSVGLNNSFRRLLKENNVFEQVRLGLEFEDNLFTVKLRRLRDTYFSACFINPDHPEMGYYILGPHSCNYDYLDIPFKPKCLIPSLMVLLYDLNRKTCCYKVKNSYSYHVRKAIDFISFKYQEDISLTDVANYLNINKSYLSSLFKKETNSSFTEILNEVRVGRSKRLLRETNYPILDIALQVGFNSQNYYNIIFKKFSNMTPMQYRNNGQ